MLIYFIILQALHLSTCYDIELEGVVRVNHDLLKRLSKHSDVRHKSSKEDSSAEIIPAVEFFNMNTPSRKMASRKSFHADQFVFNYKKNLTEKGINSLKSLEEQLDLNSNEYKSVEPIIDDYKTELKNQFEMIEKHKSEYNYDWKLALCDIIESSNKILYSFKKKLINDIVYENNTDTSDVQDIIVKAFKESVYYKRDEFNYICEEVNVCHTYPGFSDYIADLISEVLKLNSTKIRLVMQRLRKLVTGEMDFLSTVIPDEIIKLIGIEIEPAAEKELQTRELLSVLRAVITQRYKLVLSKDEGVKMRTSAIRVLLDIIDKAFNLEDDTLMSIHFDSTVKGLRQYASGDRKDINSTINTFVNHFVGGLKHHLDKSTKDEVKALSEIIMTGTSNDIDRFRYLFTKGSNFDPEEYIY